MIIRINETENRIILDSGCKEETFWYDSLLYQDECLEVVRNGEVFMVIPHNYGVIIYEDAE